VEFNTNAIRADAADTLQGPYQMTIEARSQDTLDPPCDGASESRGRRGDEARDVPADNHMDEKPADILLRAGSKTLIVRYANDATRRARRSQSVRPLRSA